MYTGVKGHGRVLHMEVAWGDDRHRVHRLKEIVHIVEPVNHVTVGYGRSFGSVNVICAGKDAQFGERSVYPDVMLAHLTQTDDPDADRR